MSPAGKQAVCSSRAQPSTPRVSTPGQNGERRPIGAAQSAPSRSEGRPRLHVAEQEQRGGWCTSLPVAHLDMQPTTRAWTFLTPHACADLPRGTWRPPFGQPSQLTSAEGRDDRTTWQAELDLCRLPCRAGANTTGVLERGAEHADSYGQLDIGGGSESHAIPTPRNECDRTILNWRIAGISKSEHLSGMQRSLSNRRVRITSCETDKQTCDLATHIASEWSTTLHGRRNMSVSREGNALNIREKVGVRRNVAGIVVAEEQAKAGEARSRRILRRTCHLADGSEQPIIAQRSTHFDERIKLCCIS